MPEELSTKKIRDAWVQDRDCQTGKFVKGAPKPRISELTRAKAIVMVATGDSSTFDPKNVAGTELGKMRVKGALEKVMAKAVNVEKQEANTLELQGRLGSLAWAQVKKATAPMKVELEQARKELLNSQQDHTNTQADLNKASEELSAQESRIRKLERLNAEHMKTNRWLKAELRASQRNPSLLDHSNKQKEIVKLAYRRAVSLPAGLLSSSSPELK